MTLDQPPDSASGYRFNITCPRCAGALHHRATGTTDGVSARAVAWCPGCSTEIAIEVRIVHVRTYNDKTKGRAYRATCGTNSGYMAHRRLEEHACQACRDAHASAVRDADERAGRSNHHRRETVNA